MNVEFWNGSESGVLRTPTLLLTACRAGLFGSRTEYSGGCVENALFTYLSGAPDRDFFRRNPELFVEKWLVCMSAEWEAFLREQPALNCVLLRRLMKPRREASTKTLKPLPDGYALSPFDIDAFSARPFGHGGNYRDFADFSARGSGAVVRFGGEIVASASSFLTVGKDVELDVSTSEAHRGKGLADHCVAAMLRDCAERGMTVHWDAQNAPSAGLAEGHGFEPEQEYAVYVLKKEK